MTKAVESQGNALKKLAKEHKKMRKSRASKESVKVLRANVDKLLADQLPLELSFEDSAPPAVAPEPQQEQAPRPRKLPNTEGVVIELLETQEIPSGDAPSIQAVHDQAPGPATEQQETRN